MSAQPVSFSFEPVQEGAHMVVTVRCGPAGSRALLGTLRMRTGEWSLLRWLLNTTPPLETNEAYIPEFAKGQTPIMCHTPIDRTPIVVQPEKWAEVLLDRLDTAIAEAKAAATAPSPGDDVSSSASHPESPT